MTSPRPTHSAPTVVPVADAIARLRDGTAVALRTSHRGRDAAIAGDGCAAITARAGGRIAGEVSYASVYGLRAVLSIKVEDAFWHRGLPELLLTALCECAAQRGIATFLMRVHARDIRLLGLLCERFDASASRNGAFVDLEFTVSGTG